MGIVQCTEGLFNVGVGRGYCSYDTCLGPPTKRVLKDTGQLALSEKKKNAICM